MSALLSQGQEKNDRLILQTFMINIIFSPSLSICLFSMKAKHRPLGRKYITDFCQHDCADQDCK